MYESGPTINFKTMSENMARGIENLTASLNRFKEQMAERKRTRHLRFPESTLERMYQHRIRQEHTKGLAFVDRKVAQVRQELGLPLTWED